MPKVVYTESKGLHQKTGSGFPYLDFAVLNRLGFDGTAANILDTSADTLQSTGVSSATDAQLNAATLNPDALNTTTYDAGAAGAMCLPAANAGVHVALILNTAFTGNSDLKIHCQGSVAETARVAAGGTAATFARAIVSLEHAAVADTDGHEIGVEVPATDHVLTLATTNGDHTAIDTDTVIHFYCVEAGKWLFRINNVNKGNMTEAVAAFSTGTT